MNYGFHLAAGGALVASHRIDTIAHNLANANTVGFKPDFDVAVARPAERLEGLRASDPLAPPQPILEKLGGGVRFDRTRVDLKQGPVSQTKNPTDVAILGEGFFVVGPDPTGKTPAAPKGTTDLTRDGALFVASDGTLRNIANTRPIIGEDGKPIVVDPTLPFAIDRAGRIYQDGDEVARIRIVRPTDPARLEKLGDAIVRSPSPVSRVQEGEGHVEQGSLEESAVDPVTALVGLLRQTRLLESNLRMIQYQDSMTGQAIAGITRVA